MPGKFGRSDRGAARRVFKCELKLADWDRRDLLSLFDRYGRAKEEFLNVVRRSPARETILGMAVGLRRREGPMRQVLANLRERIKRLLGDEVKSSLVDPCMFRFYGGSILACLRTNKRLPNRVSSDTIYLSLGKGRLINIYAWNGLILADLRVFRGRRITGILGEEEVLKEEYPHLINAIRGEDGYKLGNPCQLVRRNGRVFVHVTISRKPEPRKGKVVMGVDVGASRFIASYAVVDDTGDVKASGGVGADELNRLHREYYRFLRRVQRMSVSRKKTSRIYRALKRIAKESFGKWMGKGELLKLLYENPRLIDMLAKSLGVDRDEVVLAVRYMKRVRRMKGRGSRPIMGRNSLGISMWRVRTEMLVYRTVNTLIKTALANGVSVIAVERLKGLKRRITGRIASEMKKLGKNSAERRRLKSMMRVISRFPYRKLLEDLSREAAWYGIRVVEVSPRNTSKECPKCGYTSAKNRRSPSEFVCASCGYSNDADTVAAINIARRGLAEISSEDGGKRRSEHRKTKEHKRTRNAARTMRQPPSRTPNTFKRPRSSDGRHAE